MSLFNKRIIIEDLGLEFVPIGTYEPANENTANFIEAVKTSNKLPFDKGNYYYSDNLWDLSEFTTLNISKKSMKFKFDLCCKAFIDDLKNYVFLQILTTTTKIQSIHREFSILYDFFNFVESKGFYYIQDIDDNHISKYLGKQSKNSITTNLKVKTTLKKFYIYYANNFEDLLTKDRLGLFENTNFKAIRAYKDANKTPDIPKDYFEKFLSITVKIANDVKELHIHRATACLYIILSQTGLRIGECLELEIDSLETVTILDGHKAYYLKYKTWKRDEGNNVYSIESTYVNELTKHAYDTLISLYDKHRKKLDLKHLYLGNEKSIAKTNYPINPDRFEYNQLRYYAHLNNFFQIVNIDDSLYPDVFRKNVAKQKSVTNLYPDAKTITIPRNQQFRVHVCTELYNKNVPLKYIQKFMGHLSSEMEGYYVRPTEKNPQEDMNFTLDTLAKIVTGDTKLLGGKSSLMDKINEFIEENNYNVETDLDAICANLAKKVPIRQKTGGVCIKSSLLRECSHDARTNEFYCAYGVCPNIFHFYYMANISYRQTKELAETIQINKKQGFMRQAQKESNMLITIIKKKLVPELEELENMINKKGATSVLIEYPDLQYVVENLDNIYKEIDLWKEI